MGKSLIPENNDEYTFIPEVKQGKALLKFLEVIEPNITSPYKVKVGNRIMISRKLVDQILVGNQEWIFKRAEVAYLHSILYKTGLTNTIMFKMLDELDRDLYDRFLSMVHPYISDQESDNIAELFEQEDFHFSIQVNYDLFDEGERDAFCFSKSTFVQDIKQALKMNFEDCIHYSVSRKIIIPKALL